MTHFRSRPQWAIVPPVLGFLCLLIYQRRVHKFFFDVSKTIKDLRGLE